MRLRARVDENQKYIVAGLRKCGCRVFPTHQLGKGFPDILVRRNNIVKLFEIKNPNQPKSARRLTPAEKKFHEEWGDEIYTVETFEEAAKLMGVMI